MNFKFSIIVPVYNTEKYLRKCLNSIKNQTYDNFEVIIVNDGSTDCSLKIIEEFAGDNRFKVFTKKNGGLSDARNYGLKYVTGDYICFLDSDDYYDKDLLLKLSKVDYIYDMIRFKISLVDTDGNLIRNEKSFSGNQEVNIEKIKDLEFLEPAYIYAYKTNFFINNKFKYEVNRLHEDYGLTPLCLIKAEKIYFLDYYGYYYVQRNGSIVHSKNGNKRMEDIIFHFNKLSKIIDKEKDISEHNKETIKSILAERLIYSLKHVSVKNIGKYISIVKECKAIDYVKANPLKKCFFKMFPKLYVILLKVKECIL